MISLISPSSKSKIFEAQYKSKDIEDREYENALKLTTDVIENPDREKCDRCEICISTAKLELHHVRGEKHGNEVITACGQCHNALTANQRTWDRSWLDPDSKNKDSFLMLGLIDILKLKYEKTNKEIYKLMAEKLTEGFSYD
jgi:hypothetical protein